MGLENIPPQKAAEAGVPYVMEIRKRQKVLLRSMMTGGKSGDISYIDLKQVWRPECCDR